MYVVSKFSVKAKETNRRIEKEIKDCGVKWEKKCAQNGMNDGAILYKYHGLSSALRNSEAILP